MFAEASLPSEVTGHQAQVLGLRMWAELLGPPGGGGGGPAWESPAQSCGRSSACGDWKLVWLCVQEDQETDADPGAASDSRPRSWWASVPVTLQRPGLL